MRGELGAGVLEDAVKDGPGSVLQVVAVLVPLEMVLVGDDVGAVRISPAGEGDVERLRVICGLATRACAVSTVAPWARWAVIA